MYTHGSNHVLFYHAVSKPNYALAIINAKIHSLTQGQSKTKILKSVHKSQVEQVKITCCEAHNEQLQLKQVILFFSPIIHNTYAALKWLTT